MNQNRHPAGTSNGGKYAPNKNSDPEVGISEPGNEEEAQQAMELLNKVIYDNYGECDEKGVVWSDRDFIYDRSENDEIFGEDAFGEDAPEGWTCLGGSLIAYNENIEVEGWMEMKSPNGRYYRVEIDDLSSERDTVTEIQKDDSWAFSDLQVARKQKERAKQARETYENWKKEKGLS